MDKAIEYEEIEVKPSEVLRSDLILVGTNRWEAAEQAWDWETDQGYRKIGIKLQGFYWPIVRDAYPNTKLTVRRRKG